MLILASGSPRRSELLKQVGLKFQICKANGEEITTCTEPENIVKELSLQKAQDVAMKFEKASEEEEVIILGADTIVSVDHQVLGKPKTEEEAFSMIERIAGKSHEVCTGVALIGLKDGKEFFEDSFAVTTQVMVYPMTKDEITGYISKKESMDKAGAYGIQGAFAAYIQGIQGDYNNVVGLPVGEVCQRLKLHGVQI